MAAAYARRGWRPIWVEAGRPGPQADELVDRLAGARDDGLRPDDATVARLRAVLAKARSGDPVALGRAEAALTAAAAGYLVQLHSPSAGARMAFWDPAVPAPAEAAAARLFDAGFAEAARMHPIYAGLRAELQRRGPDDPLRPLILANMDRARALPADRGERHVIVDAAAQRLWLYDGGQAIDTMKVVVGTRRDPTPTLTGLIRWANYQPYWNVPVDIVQEEIAPHVVREGVSYLARQQMEALSDWTPEANVLDPASVDWRAVAAGEQALRLRRRPGETNILGRVKLMLPNPLGIYLHDTPGKAAFARNERMLSHGCIRLEDAPRLARRLIGPAAETPPAGDDARLDLPRPVPVYVVYFTLSPGEHGLERRRDIYARDAALIAAVTARLAA
jgi:murein L,D-transpeptidase YcbB/YkuD